MHILRLHDTRIRFLLVHIFHYLSLTQYHSLLSVRRNHGPVPQLSWESHRITVSGVGVPQPHTFSMDELLSLPQRTLPVTLVCAGNRRKEVNVQRKSKGFNWGAGAVSNSLWTGVPLHVLLEQCGLNVRDLPPGSYWVNFDGPDGELPKGVYGTSIPLRKVRRFFLFPACFSFLEVSVGGWVVSPPIFSNQCVATSVVHSRLFPRPGRPFGLLHAPSFLPDFPSALRPSFSSLYVLGGNTGVGPCSGRARRAQAEPRASDARPRVPGPHDHPG